MIKIYMSLSYRLYVELRDDLYLNGYKVIWHSQECIEVNDADFPYVQMVLNDRGITFYVE